MRKDDKTLSERFRFASLWLGLTALSAYVAFTVLMVSIDWLVEVIG